MIYPRPAGETESQYLEALIAELEYARQDETIESERRAMSLEIVAVRKQLDRMAGAA